jgi:outer membrane receptor for Fe3+-dicitrate
LENANINRDFRITDRVGLNLRLEFDNIFNRAYINNPQAPTPFFPRATTPGGAAAGGFGFINTATSSTQFGQPRQGMIIARFAF